MSRTQHAPDGRGQTLPDFTVAIAIFLLTITFISLFVPQIIQPFDDQEQPVVAERITGHLSNSELVEAGSLQLNETATTEFFNTTDTDADVLDAVGVSRGYSVNITLRDGPSQNPDSTILCDDGGEIGTSCGEKLQIGPVIPADGQSVSTTRRTLFLDNRDVVLEVGVWYDG